MTNRFGKFFPISVKELPLSKIWLANNVLLFRRTDAGELKGKAQANTPHRRYVLCVCGKGSGSVFIDHQRIDLVENSAVLISPFHFHHYDFLVASELEWIFLTFDSETDSPILTGPPHALSLTPRLIKDLDDLCRHFCRRGSGLDENHFLIKVNSFLYDLLHKERPAEADALSPSSREISWAERIQQELEKEPSLSISALAKKLGYSEGHLRSLFRAKQNMPLNDYVNHYRLHWAIGQLHDRSRKLIDIATELGFSSQASFTRFFKRMTKSSPAKFRREVLAP